MAKTKISKIAKDLNVALPTVIEFLRKKNITIDDNPNTRVEDNVVDILVNEFRSDKDQKSKSEQFSSERQKEKTKPAQKEATKPVEEITWSVEPTAQPKIVGKNDINKNGKTAPKAPEKKEEPKAIVMPKEEAKSVDKKPKAKPAEEKPAQPQKKEEPKKEPIIVEKKEEDKYKG